MSHYLNSVNEFDKLFTSNLILAAGTLFSLSAGYFAWCQNKLYRQLAKQKLFSESILNSMKDSLVVLDKSQRIRHVNHSAVELLGYSETELKHKAYSHLTNVGLLKDLEPDRLNHYLETTYRCVDGKEIPVSLSYAEMKDEWGEPCGVVCIAQDITHRKQQEEKIKKSLQEKMILLKEIHDRVKNNLQVVSSIIRMHVRHYKNKELESFYDATQHRIQSVALVHEVLYQAHDLSCIDASVYLRRIVSSFLQSRTGFPLRPNIDFDVAPISLGIHQVIPCGLIIHELLTDYFNPAFPGEKQGTIIIRLRVMPDHGTGDLSISCRGDGLLKKSAASSERDFGIRLIETLVKQLHGTLRWPRDGDIFLNIHFPLTNRAAVGHV